MEVFNNQQRSGYEEIASYGPKWWTEFREMDANYRFAGWTLDLMAYWMERVVNNQFPANADERTITTVFEPALGIEPEPDETLEERLSRQDEAMEIQKILHDLPDPYKEVFMWRVFAELSYRQIGQLFGKSENWACVTYHRGRNLIRERLEGSSHEK